MRSLLLGLALVLSACTAPPPMPETAQGFPPDLQMVCHEGHFALVSPSLRQGLVLPFKCMEA